VAAISDADKKAIGDKWAQSLQPHMAAFAAAAPAAAGAIDAKKIFCDDWPAAKTALQALQAFVPQPGPIIIGLAISAGDAAHSTICGK
jgi:hypothetical protein